MRSIIALGPDGSNSHAAAIDYAKRMGVHESSIILRENSNYEIVREIAKSNDYIALVAIENLRGGLVQDTIEAMDEYYPVASGEHYHRVSHCLAWNGNWGGVKAIYTHPQAARQCRKYLRENMPDLEVKEAKSTAHAAQLASHNPEIAAICTELAARIYGLTSFVSDIQDLKNNVTRFIALSNDECKATGNDKTSMRYEVENKSGALADILDVFRDQGLNLSCHHSIGTGEGFGKYYQFTEFEAHVAESKVQTALKQLTGLIIPNSLNVFGSYPRHDNSFNPQNK